MKKLIAIVMVFLLCLSLLACNTPPEPSGTGETSGTGDTGNTGTPTEPGFVEVPKPDSLPVSGWKTGSNTGHDAYAFTENGCYFLFNQCLCFLDTATGYSVALCSKPGCHHGEETSQSALRDCDAYVSGACDLMFFYNGGLYYAVIGQYGAELYTRAPDGTNLRKVGVLGEQYASKNTSVQLNQWVFAYGKLYYTLTVEEQTPDGKSSTISLLARFDLSSEKEAELLRSTDELIALRSANEDMAIVWASHRPTVEEIQRPDYKEYIKQFPAYLRLWHQESGGVSTLCEMESAATNSSLGFANGKLHMFGGTGTKVYAYDFASMTFGDSDLPEGVNRIWSEKYGGVNWKGYYDLETGTYYTNEYDAIQLPAGIEEFGASPFAFGEQGFIVEEYYSKDHIVIFGNTVYFSFEKMTDGLQLSDRVIFMRHDEKGSQILQPES